MDIVTDQGGAKSKYQENEDSAFTSVDEDGETVFGGVTDGAGGSKKGKEASAIITRTISVRLKELRKINPSMLLKDRIQASFIRASAAVEKTLKLPNGEVEGYGCSVLCGINKKERQVVIGNVGDTRGYIIVERRQMTSEKIMREIFVANASKIHNDAGEKYAKDGRRIGKEYLQAPPDDKRLLNQSIGRSDGEPLLDPDVIEFQGQEGDLVTVVLASDGGIGDRIGDFELLSFYDRTSGDPKELSNRLTTLAEGRNGSDEVQVLSEPNVSGVPQRVRIPNRGDSDNYTVGVVQVRF